MIENIIEKKNKVVEILKEYPDITVIEDENVDTYRISQYSEDQSLLLRTINISLEKSTYEKSVNPCISYNNELTNSKARIELVSKAILFSGDENVDIDSLLELAYKGLSIIKQWESLPLESRQQMGEEYLNRVCARRIGTENFDSKCLDITLEKIIYFNDNRFKY